MYGIIVCAVWFCELRPGIAGSEDIRHRNMGNHKVCNSISYDASQFAMISIHCHVWILFPVFQTSFLFHSFFPSIWFIFNPGLPFFTPPPINHVKKFYLRWKFVRSLLRWLTPFNQSRSLAAIPVQISIKKKHTHTLLHSSIFKLISFNLSILNIFSFLHDYNTSRTFQSYSAIRSRNLNNPFLRLYYSYKTNRNKSLYKMHFILFYLSYFSN